MGEGDRASPAHGAGVEYQIGVVDGAIDNLHEYQERLGLHRGRGHWARRRFRRAQRSHGHAATVAAGQIQDLVVWSGGTGDCGRPSLARGAVEGRRRPTLRSRRRGRGGLPWRCHGIRLTAPASVVSRKFLVLQRVPRGLVAAPRKRGGGAFPAGNIGHIANGRATPPQTPWGAPFGRSPCTPEPSAGEREGGPRRGVLTPRKADRVVVLANMLDVPCGPRPDWNTHRRERSDRRCGFRAGVGVAGPEAAPGRSGSEAPDRLWGACIDAQGEL